MQSVVEAGTKICADISEARAEIPTLRGTLAAHLAPARHSGHDQERVIVHAPPSRCSNRYPAPAGDG